MPTLYNQNIIFPSHSDYMRGRVLYTDAELERQLKKLLYGGCSKAFKLYYNKHAKVVTVHCPSTQLNTFLFNTKDKVMFLPKKRKLNKTLKQFASEHDYRVEMVDSLSCEGEPIMAYIWGELKVDDSDLIDARVMSEPEEILRNSYIDNIRLTAETFGGVSFSYTTFL